MKFFPVPLEFLLLLCFFSSSFADQSALAKRKIPAALFRSCQVHGLARACTSAIREAWKDGRFRTVTSTHNFYAYFGCKITLWCEVGTQVLLQDVEQVLAAAQQIDDFCNESKIETGGSVPKSGSRGGFVGRLSGQYVAMQLDATV